MTAWTVHGVPVLPVAVAAGWFAVLLLVLFPLAARHWITAWLTACVLLAAAWGFILSVAFGPADLRWHWTGPALWWPDARHDAALVVTWADPLKPWQLAGVIGAVGVWCALMRAVRKRHDARVIARAARPVAAPVPVAPRAGRR